MVCGVGSVVCGGMRRWCGWECVWVGVCVRCGGVCGGMRRWCGWGVCVRVCVIRQCGSPLLVYSC